MWTFVIPLHVHVIVYMSVDKSDMMWCLFEFICECVCVCVWFLQIIGVISIGMKENTACASEQFCCHFVLVILPFLPFKKMICFSNWTFWLVRRECYTISKSGPKHQKRQTESWAHKLHWCGIIWSFACGASLPSLSLLSFILSWNDLKMYNFFRS